MNTNDAPSGFTSTPPENPAVIEPRLVGLGPLSDRGKWALLLCAVLFGLGFAAFIHQLRHGLAVTAMNDYFSWGVYIVNFVFFIGISMAGSLISAILRLTGAEWRKPITRIAEGITVFALIVAAFMIVVDMGRPDRFLYTIIYGRVQSPILWDVFSLSTYLAGSVLFLYLPLIPDFAILRDQGARFAPWRAKLYARLALGWRGTPEQHHRLERIMTVMSVAIIPVAVSIHTVTAWIFGMTLRPGWHSTIIGPDFVVGALYSGIAAVISIVAILRWVYHLENHITVEHFKKLSLLLLVAGVAYAYFMVNEYMGAVYTNEKAESDLVDKLFHGHYAAQFWTMAGFGLVLPCVMLSLPKTRTLGGIVTASVLVNIGMWLKRFIIVVPTLSSPFLPVTLPTGQHFGYVPTWVEWAITVGGFACFSLLYAAFSKFVPVVSLWETETTTSQRPAESAEPNADARTMNGIKSVAGLVLLIGIGVITFVSRPLLANENAAQTSPISRGTQSSSTAGGLEISDAANGKPASPPNCFTLLAQASTATASTPSTPAAAPQTTTPKPDIALKLSVEEGKRVIVATVKTNDKPLEGAKVAILVKRTFGDLALGTEETLDDGTAAVPFPEGLPGDGQGMLQVVAELKSPKEFVGARAQTTLPGGRIIPPEKEPFPRALWSPRAPLVLVATIFVVLGAVWGTYTYVVVQLIKIRKNANT